MGHFSQLDAALRADGVITPAMRREWARQREDERHQRIEHLAATGRLCGYCRQSEVEADGLCRLCLNLREQKRQEREQDRIAQAAYRARATEAGIVVGAQVHRKGGTAMGTVIEVLGNAVRVSWRNHQREQCPSWCNGRHHCTYIKALGSLVAVR